jgi:hypothetical protein
MQMYADMMGKLEAALKTLTAPKRIVRGPDGRAAGVEVVQQPLPFAMPPQPPAPPVTQVAPPMAQPPMNQPPTVQ